MSPDFDPNRAAAPGSGAFGLPHSPEEARFVLLPVPFDATTSYRDGARNGPAAILEASRQVDLYDLDFGRVWEPGIAMLPLSGQFARTVARLNRAARRAALPVIAAGGVDAGVDAGNRRLAAAAERVNAAGAELNALVESTAGKLLARGQVPVVVGGDHSTPFGAIRAYARRFPGLGILHVDAHADLRQAYEGFTWSHASIMYNVTRAIGIAGGVAMLVQVGLRDLGEDELERCQGPARLGATPVRAFFEPRLRERLFAGETWRALADEIADSLPRRVYVSFDIDGLDPALCPDTGTPVPGGLSFAEAVELLRAVVRSGRTVVGADLNEVAPSPRLLRSDWGSDANAMVGARLLYKLLGAIAASGRPRPGADAAPRPSRRSGSGRRRPGSP